MIQSSRTIDLRVNTSTGGTGVDGIDGVDGLSAYELAVKHGFLGTEEEFVQSLGITTSWGKVQIDWIGETPIAIRKYKDIAQTVLLETITPTFVDGLPSHFSFSSGSNIALYWSNGLPIEIQRS